MAGPCSVPLCFPKVQEGLPWQEKLWKYGTASKRKTVPCLLVQFRRAAGKSALFLVAALSRCSLELSTGEAGGIPAPFSCCHWERRLCINCLPGREWCQHSDNVEFLVVYVHFRSSVYIQKIAVYLAVLSGLEFSGSWNAFLTLLFFFPMLIHSPRSVTVSSVVVEYMQLPSWSAEKFGLSWWSSAAAKTILRCYFNGSSASEYTWIIWFMACPGCWMTFCVVRFGRKYKLL